MLHIEENKHYLIIRNSSLYVIKFCNYCLIIFNRKTLDDKNQDNKSNATLDTYYKTTVNKKEANFEKTKTKNE